MCPLLSDSRARIGSNLIDLLIVEVSLGTLHRLFTFCSWQPACVKRCAVHFWWNKNTQSLPTTLEIFWRRQWHPTPVLLPGKSHGWRSLEGCSPWSRWGSDTTKQLHFHFSLSCIGEGNGNPLQCSCLENPRNGGAWWAAVYGVAQSQTRLAQILFLEIFESHQMLISRQTLA